MSVSALPKVFLKTAASNLNLRNRSQAGREAVKKDWGESILRILGFSCEVKGKLPDPGAGILVGNHISFLDIPLIMGALPTAVFVAKDDLLSWPIVGSGAKNAGTVFVSRKVGEDRSSARDAILKILLESDSKVVVFPAGTSTLHEEVAWKKGIFEIAKEAGLPVYLFKLDYSPLRECAYIADDLLLPQILGMTRLKNKTASLTWIERFDQIDDPIQFAEKLRHQVVNHE